MTIQRAQHRIAEINKIRFLTGKNTDREIAEHQELLEGLVAGKYPAEAPAVASVASDASAAEVAGWFLEGEVK